MDSEKHGFFKNNSGQTNISFIEKVTALLDQLNALLWPCFILLLDFSKDFDKDPNDILNDKLIKCWSDG